MDANQFKQAREALRMSQSQLAEALGLSLSAIRAKEYGRIRVSRRDMIQLGTLTPLSEKRGPGNPNLK
jgi:DNA-binding XRE family transcriptional regulator